LHFLSIILDKDCSPYFPSPFQVFKNQNAPLPSFFDEWNRQRTLPLTIKKNDWQQAIISTFDSH